MDCDHMDNTGFDEGIQIFLSNLKQNTEHLFLQYEVATKIIQKIRAK